MEQDLLRDVIPAVESLYRVERGARHRAIAGESKGGYQALAYGLRHTETFGNIGVFSAGAHGAEGRKQVVEAVAAGKLKRFGLFGSVLEARTHCLRTLRHLTMFSGSTTSGTDTL